MWLAPLRLPGPRHAADSSVSDISPTSAYSASSCRLHFPDMAEVWVFGYGSLTWHPGFEFRTAVVGRIAGYARRFWQGNTTHRGTANKPGRVATLVEDQDSAVWGRAFLVKDSSALPYLDTRECQLGGYVTRTVTFQPLDSSLRPFQALLYLATPSNHLWLGEAPEQEIAAQILTSSGPTGHNVEYLLRLADFMRVEVPGVEDDHLFALEDLVWKGIRERNLSIGRLMGGPAANQRVPPPASPPLPTNQNADRFAGRVPSKKLRCLGI